jgi:hypothetical protein
MEKLPDLIMLLMLYGGIGGIGLGILLISTHTIQRRWAIFTIAIISGILFSVQTLLLYFFSEINRGWGGDSFGIIPWLMGTIGATAIVVFLIIKLRRYRVFIASNEMKSGTHLVNIAAGIAVFYFISSIIRILFAPYEMILAYLSYPHFWMISLGSLFVAIGLWRRTQSGWYMGLLGGAWQTQHYIIWLIKLSGGIMLSRLSIISVFSMLLLLIFCLILLLPSVRHACIN